MANETLLKMNGNNCAGILSVIPSRNKSENELNTIIFLDSSKFVSQYATSEKSIAAQNVFPDKLQNQKNIFSCLFCQVFSSSYSSIVDHIIDEHSNSIPAGVAANNFVSKLKSLQDKNQTGCLKKVGRPRKNYKKCAKTVEEKKVLSEPVPRSDGSYWCNKCVKSFKKSRQLKRHVCFKDEQAFDDFSSDSDTTADYQIYMDVEPTPWSRKLTKKSNCQDLCGNSPKVESNSNSLLNDNPQTKAKLHWRNDPEYIHLFQDENERIAFENHINSIDYSCSDSLFTKKENKMKIGMKKNGPQRSITSYSCTLCLKKMNSLTHIRMHCLSHTDLQPFTCPKCPYRSNTKGNLYTHMRNHTGNVFHCSQCTFQSLKRSHLLEHEETHSSVPQMCKLCKNSYKTVKSLIAHIKRCHNYPGGQKYAKSLSSKKPKECRLKCKVCQKIFRSAKSLQLHNKIEHSVPIMPLPENDAEVVTNGTPENLVVEELSTMSSKCDETFTNEVLTVKDPFAEIVLSSLLQQKRSVSTELYEDVFEESSQLLTPSEELSSDVLENCSTTRLSNVPINNCLRQSTSQLPSKGDLDECDKNINFDILNECLRNPTFADEVMRETFIDASKLTEDCNQPFSLNASIDLAYQNESLIPSVVIENEQTNSNVDKNELAEPKSAEVKLFEKCRRAPAYVCCVCQGIFICTATLKAHLKEHVNSSNSLMEEFDQPKMTETRSTINGVCSILQEPSTSRVDNEMITSEFEKELEKLYSSSLDTIWYLPEVSVVLENDLSLFDAFLDDISNFSIPD